MKKAIGIGVALVTLLFIVGCKPAAREVTAGLDLATDVATLKTDVENLNTQMSDMWAAIDGISASLDSLTTAFEDHMKKFHTTTTKIPRPVKKPSEGGPVRRPSR